MYKSRNKILGKLLEKLLKYRIMFKDIITFLGIDYKDAPLITLNIVVLGISFPKIADTIKKFWRPSLSKSIIRVGPFIH